jgi:hypothetical protein
MVYSNSKKSSDWAAPSSSAAFKDSGFFAAVLFAKLHRDEQTARKQKLSDDRNIWLDSVPGAGM